MKKILFPTDFSDASKNAFIYALKLAKNIDAEIITLHVYELPAIDYIEVPVYLLKVYEITELSNFENYKHQVPVLRKIAEDNHLEHIKISNVLDNGNLIDNILKITKEEKIDYIVMGTKGATGFASTFLGSVTTKVMNETKTVVLAIPEHCQYEPIKKILFTTQFKDEDVEVLKKVIDLAKVFHSHVDCLYVKKESDYDKEKSINKWKKTFKDDSVDFHIVLSNDAEGIILNFIDMHKINMITMHVHHRNFFEKLFHISLSKKLAFHITIPILAIH
jgi:nucleotide-binding universal stress UspA family protein